MIADDSQPAPRSHDANALPQLFDEDILNSAKAEVNPKPLVKWPGGKRKLVRQLLQVVPQDYGTYIEPFCGGAALFFALRPHKAVLGDANADLISCYKAVAESPEEVIEACSALSNSCSEYLRVRDSEPNDKVERAARFLFLCRLSFNGIYRENRKGKFNVPYGGKDHLEPCDAENVRLASQHLKCAKLIPGDFETAVATAQCGDLVYFDPPYTVAHNNNGFVKYNAKLFSWDDQQRLARVACDLSAKGCSVIVSNASHDDIRLLYDGFSELEIKRSSVIAASSQHRRLVSESVFYNVQTK